MPSDFNPIAVLRFLNESYIQDQDSSHILSGFSSSIYYHLFVFIQNLHQKVDGVTAVKYCFSVSWLVFFSGILLIWTFWPTDLKFDKISREPKASLLAIQALSAVFTPVSVAWPLPFASFFENSRLAKHGSIEIDIIALLHHICQGDLELRDSDDLGYLFQGKLQVYGWKIKIYIQPKWWMKNTIWTLGQRFGFSPARPRTNASPASRHSKSLSRYLGRSIDLDFIPFFHLQKEVCRIQLTLQPKLPTVLEFSCLQSGIGFSTLKFLLCSVPFLPYLSHQKEGRKSNRTSTPLLAKMQDIVAMFSTGSIIIEDVINISYEHASGLRHKERNLVHDREMRRAHIKQVGLIGWREDRLMLLWEAGLLRSGYLHRWRMIIRK